MLTVLVMYLFAIVGWSLFAEVDPARWGNLGLAMLTMFQLLTHRDWPSVLHPLREVSPFAVPFVVSYIIVTAFFLVQFLVGIILNSLDGAREEVLEHDVAEQLQGSGTNLGLLSGIEAMRASLDRLEQRRASARPVS